MAGCRPLRMTRVPRSACPLESRDFQRPTDRRLATGRPRRVARGDGQTARSLPRLSAAGGQSRTGRRRAVQRGSPPIWCKKRSCMATAISGDLRAIRKRSFWPGCGASCGTIWPTFIAVTVKPPSGKSAVSDRWTRRAVRTTSSRCSPRSPTPSWHVIAREEADALEEAIARLPADYGRIIHLVHRENLSFAEAAQAMNRSADAVRRLWGRAVELLADELDATDGDR